MPTMNATSISADSDGGHPGEQAQQQAHADQDLQHRQAVADGGHDASGSSW